MGEELYELPKGWVWVTVNETIQIIDYRGRTPPFSENGIPHLRSSNIKKGKIIWQGLAFVSEETYQEYMTRGIPKKGDVLFTTEAPLGEVALAPELKFSLAQRMMILRPSESVLSPKFLLYQIASEEFQARLKGKGTGTTVQGISSRNFKHFKIVVAPLSEQHRIVAKIEELFTQLDAGVELLKKVKAKLKRYRQAVLKAAVEGNLTKEWREANQGELEPVSVLLERILKQRRQKWEAEQLAKMKAQGKIPKDDSWKLKYKEAIAPDTSDLPELPDGWCWVTVEQLLSESMCNGLSIKGSETPPGVPALKLNAMSEYGFNYTFIRYLPINPRDVINIEIQEDDFFVSRGNGTLELVGRGTLAQKPPFTVIFPDTMIRLRFTHIINSTRWIPCIWQSRLIRGQIERKVKTTAGIWKISQSELASITIPLASFIEQQQIVTEVERIFSVTDQLEKTIDTNLKRAEKLRQTILKQAFEGKLVPQDPNDEPAEKLLERIKAEKAKREADKKPKRQSTIKSKRSRKSKTTATQLELKLDD